MLPYVTRFGKNTPEYDENGGTNGDGDRGNQQRPAEISQRKDVARKALQRFPGFQKRGRCGQFDLDSKILYKVLMRISFNYLN